MSKVFFISDLHLGHKLMVKPELTHLRSGSLNVDDHDQWIIEQFNRVVTKNDLTWILGDVCFDKKKLPLLKRLNGCKHLILGNHDEFTLIEYSKYFNKIHGFTKYKGIWLSHCPINPRQLRGKWNMHGHVHTGTLEDLRYINVCVEVLKGCPISWDAIELMMADRRLLLPKDEK